MGAAKPRHVKDWSRLSKMPIPLEAAAEYGLENMYKHWRETPHKRYDWILTDDNWLVCVTWCFPNGDYSVSTRWILTKKRCESKNIGFRLFEFHYKRVRFNNRLKILVNTAIILGDWEKAYAIAYNKKARSLTDILRELDSNAEDYLVGQLEKLLTVNGVTKDFVIETFKNMAMGYKVDSKGELVDDRTVKDETRAKILLMFAKWLGLDVTDPKQVVYNDNRRTEINYGEMMKQLKEYEE